MSTFRTPAFEKSGTFFKVDQDQGIAYGWAIVCSENGVPYFDLQGDHIPESVMVEALADFAKNSRVGKDQHQGDATGEHIFVYPMTKSVAAGLGIKTAKMGALVGYKPTNPADLALIATGARTGFSIGGVLLESDETDIGKSLLQKAHGPGPRKGRVFRTFKIHEISIVDRPAQEGATVGFVKRASLVNDTIAKAVKLTSVDDGHQHVVYLDSIMEGDYCGTSYDISGGMSDPDSHNHRVVVEDGIVKLSTNAGHTHSIEVPKGWQPRVPTPPGDEPAPATATGVDVMTAREVKTPAMKSDTPPADVEPAIENLTASHAAGSVSAHQEPKMTTEQIADLNKKLLNATRYGELTDVQKTYHAKLAPSSQDAFLEKSASARQAEVDGAVVHKTADGVLYFNTDDQRLVGAVKQNEALAKSLHDQQTLTAKALHLDFAKSVIGNVAGEDATKIAIAECVATIKDDKVRTDVITMLKSADAAVSMLAKTNGHQVLGLEVNNAETAFYKARDEFAKANSIDMSTDGARAVATRKFMQTQEGAPLYKAYTQSKPAQA